MHTQMTARYVTPLPPLWMRLARFAVAPEGSEDGGAPPAPKTDTQETPPAPSPANMPKRTETTKPPAETHEKAPSSDEPSREDLLAIVADLRRENASRRVSQKEQIDKIASILGLTENDEKPTMEDIQRQLETERAAGVQRDREHAAYRIANSKGLADPDALLDSITFTRSLAELDPTDTEGITKAITDAVKHNQRLAAPQAGAQRSHQDIPNAGRAGANTNSVMSLEEAVAQMYS